MNNPVNAAPHTTSLWASGITISLVVAASANNAIGKNNRLLWHLPNDMRFFKNITWAMPVAYGRKTFEALCSKPLPGRLNIMITRNNNFAAEGITVVNTVNDALLIAKQNGYKELMIIGGGEIYKETIRVADYIYLTRVHHVFDEADTFFPEINQAEWTVISGKEFNADAKHAYPYSFQIWKRK